MKLAVLLAALCAGLCFAADAKDDAGKKELEKLQGTWKVVKAVKQGKASSDDELPTLKVLIAGDRLTLRDKKGDETIPFTIDPSKKPTTIDLKAGKRTLQGIYELDKDALKICVDLGGDRRPTEYKSADMSETILMVLVREKK